MNQRGDFMDIQEDKLYKLTEVCKITGIGRSTANLYAQQGVLKCIKIGKVWRMKGKDLKELLEHGTEPAGSRSGEVSE